MRALLRRIGDRIPIAAAALAGVFLFAEAGLAQPKPVPATCGRDLFQLDGEMHRQMRRLQQVAGADISAQCNAWRDQVSFLQRARGVFAACQSGRQREENVAQMDGSIAEYRVLLVQRCRAR